MQHNPQIETYISLLKDYNAHTNVYSRKAYDKLPFHIEDSENIAALIGDEPGVVVDFGSGSGLPSVILAICCPNATVYAVETKQKKIKFLESVKALLGLDNLVVAHMDAYNFILHHKKLKPDFITAKAFASFEKVYKLAQKIASSKTTLIIPISEDQVSEIKASKIGSPHFESLDPYYYLIQTF